MKTKKKLGICMDHANAHLIAFAHPMETKIVTSGFTYSEKEKSLTKSERMMHDKQQHEESEYYKKIAEFIRDYDEVLLFGPTEAKVELFNMLKADHLFSKIKFEIKQTDKMTENQEHAFVKDYFLKHSTGIL